MVQTGICQAGDHAEPEEGLPLCDRADRRIGDFRLAAAKLWIDFSKQREGPAGSGLLSLLYGLKGHLRHMFLHLRQLRPETGPLQTFHEPLAR